MMGDRRSVQGVWLTKALFWEERHPDYTPSFTLKETDREENGVVYPSLKQIYLEYSDPTEYSFAIEVIGSWEHWQTLCKSFVFRPYIKKWREELEVKLRSEALKAMRETARNEGSKGTTAAKYLAEKGWEKKAGRPSKAEIKRQARIDAGIHSEIDEDAERLGLLN
jgi:hypothetical protein